MDLNLNDLLRQYRSDPYEHYRVEAVHTGVVTFRVRDGDEVNGPSGRWMHRPGSLLYLLERERNVKKIYSPWSGIVADAALDLDGRFVEAGEFLMSIRHRLGKEEIIDRILTRVLHIFAAPQRARYFLVPELAAKIEKAPGESVRVRPGDEAIIMSLMKRDTLIHYEGLAGVIYKVYFQSGALVEQGAPLLGICPPEKLPYVQRVIQRVRTEWEE
ncbi:hypothetical protein G3N55_02460 [Dissulfurirhabdus thermomarina]|uniref:Uncharacterized protein n=1 Tax=Dissulfurirhabdus thermomarina TaxID=1765737 RepID=A0A6N9TKE3_DISTH|nr:hypothetical protein [Dissulfurirhabdus thermomarina]NDY41715.1 hypothetical protein [Dissulfurirhabdus thermomarina]NMX23201.1 hypothetical protein [Dissulfurirhabdus thermomarina]